MLTFELTKSPFDNDGVAVIKTLHTGSIVYMPYRTLYRYIVGRYPDPSHILLNSGNVVCPRCIDGVCDRPHMDDNHVTDDNYCGVINLVKSNCVCNTCALPFTIHNNGDGWEYDMPHINEPSYSHDKHMIGYAVGTIIGQREGYQKI